MPDRNGHDAWRGLRQADRRGMPLECVAAVALGRFQQRIGVHRS
ncbi:TPA: hypothetical protein ACW5VC_000673 [Yersinia enterocolitica]